ncbi:MAG: sigma-70 family RNA polymerase sigma factor [Oscillospiraceae bacterium]|nr:sigma-70 family RNA polymerase sigma factor [Oscillospiraceae bacterium]
MSDNEIIGLYLDRAESAITATAKQYGAYCTAIAMNILHNKEDADECVNDAYMKLWNSIPPERPEKFSAYIGKIARNLSIMKYKKLSAQKRGGSGTDILLSELDSCVPTAATAANVENKAEMNELVGAINDFLSAIKKEDRLFFVSRYWYADTVPEIAKSLNVGESRVGVSLHRTRKKLRVYLEKRGITL